MLFDSLPCFYCMPDWIQAVGCGIVQSGDFFEVSCTDKNGDPISEAESVILNEDTFQGSYSFSRYVL